MRNDFSKIFADFLTLENYSNWKRFANRSHYSTAWELTLRRPLHKKWGWSGFSTFPRWRSRVFFESDLTDPPQIFDAHLLKNSDLSPSSFHFSVGFYNIKYYQDHVLSQMVLKLIRTNEIEEKKGCLFTITEITAFYIKKYLFLLN